MTTLASKLRSQQGWVWSVAVLVALACGNITSPPHSTPNEAGGEANVDTPSAGAASVDAPSGGKATAFGGATSVGGTTGGLTLVTAGTSPDTPNHPDFGGTGAGGEPVFGEASLCIYPEDIPANWGPDMVTVGHGHECPVGVLGSFFFMDCPYELLDVTPHDVDPFTGGHSHCCYKSRLRPCR